MRKGGYEKITFPFFSGWWIASSGWKRIFCTQGRSVSGSIKAIAPYSVGVIAKPYSLSRAGCRWPTMEPSVKPFSVSLIRREPRSSEARWRKADWNGEAENGREATLRRQGVPCPAATSRLSPRILLLLYLLRPNPSTWAGGSPILLLFTARSEKKQKNKEL